MGEFRPVRIRVVVMDEDGLAERLLDQRPGAPYLAQEGTAERGVTRVGRALEPVIKEVLVVRRSGRVHRRGSLRAGGSPAGAGGVEESSSAATDKASTFNANPERDACFH